MGNVPRSTFAITDPYQAEMLRLRFRGKFKRTEDSECWPWSGFCNKNGYGVFCIRRPVSMLAHRAAWELNVGPIPEGLSVLHHCDNPPCINWVTCLFLGTTADNMHDMFAKNRRPSVSLKGERNGGSKLTDEQAREVRALKGVRPYREVMAEYGIGQSTLYRIWETAGPHWSHIKG